MGNSSSSSPRTYRRRSPAREKLQDRSKTRRESLSQDRSKTRSEAPSRSRKGSRKSGGLPRDPVTGRYLPRSQRSASPARAASPSRGRKAESPSRRRVEVEVVRAPRKSSPRRQRAEAEEPPVKSRVTFAEKLERQEMEPTARGSPILRSSYTRMTDAPEAEVPVQRPTRARSASPTRRTPATKKTTPATGCKTEATRLPVSRREYASPSLASTSAVDENQILIGPSTTRRMKKMAADVDQIAEAPQPERMSQTAPQGNLEQILFSYMNSP